MRNEFIRRRMYALHLLRILLWEGSFLATSILRVAPNMGKTWLITYSWQLIAGLAVVWYLTRDFGWSHFTKQFSIAFALSIPIAVVMWPSPVITVSLLYGLTVLFCFYFAMRLRAHLLPRRQKEVSVDRGDQHASHSEVANEAE